jgi:hypothetical protein
MRLLDRVRHALLPPLLLLLLLLLKVLLLSWLAAPT